MANDAMAVCAAGSMGVGPGVKRRFLRSIQRILAVKVTLVYRNRVAPRTQGEGKKLNHEGHEVTRRLFEVAFPSCTFVPFVVLAFRLASIIPTMTLSEQIQK